jgi:hypothetical protein
MQIQGPVGLAFAVGNPEESQLEVGAPEGDKAEEEPNQPAEQPQCLRFPCERFSRTEVFYFRLIKLGRKVESTDGWPVTMRDVTMPRIGGGCLLRAALLLQAPGETGTLTQKKLIQLWGMAAVLKVNFAISKADKEPLILDLRNKDAR